MADYQPPTLDTVQTAEETHPNLSEKEVYLLILELWSEGQAFGTVHSKGMRNGIFPAKSVTKDITVINDCNPPV